MVEDAELVAHGIALGARGGGRGRALELLALSLEIVGR